jgi:hypothetical protein
MAFHTPDNNSAKILESFGIIVGRVLIAQICKFESEFLKLFSDSWHGRGDSPKLRKLGVPVLIRLDITLGKDEHL